LPEIGDLPTAVPTSGDICAALLLEKVSTGEKGGAEKGKTTYDKKGEGNSPDGAFD